MADQATGLSISFDTGFFAEIVNCRLTGIRRGAVRTTHSGTTTWETFKPSDLIDGGILEVECHFISTDITPPITGAAATVTVTLPKVTPANTTAPSIAFSGFLIEIDYDFPPIDDVTMKFTARIKVTGEITFTNEAA
jgi:hypothetical protein